MPFIPSDLQIAGNPTEFFMKQTPFSPIPHYDIYDQNRQLMYFVEGDIARLRLSVMCRGAEIIRLKKKVGSFKLDYMILRGSQEIGAIRKESIIYGNDNANGVLFGNMLNIINHYNPDRFDIALNRIMIGQVVYVPHGITDLGDSYNVISFDPNLQDIIIALAVVCDKLKDIRDSYSD